MHRNLAAVFLAIALLLAAWAGYEFLLNSGNSGITNKANSGNPQHWLATTDKIDVFYTLDEKDRKIILKLVESFCVKSYDAASCSHYLITCGSPCLGTIPQSEYQRIFNGYNQLRVSKGLPPVPGR
jgi:hypothetical protein